MKYLAIRRSLFILFALPLSTSCSDQSESQSTLFESVLATPGSARTEVFVAEYIDDGQSHRQVVARRMEWRAWKDGPDKVSESSYPRIVAEHE